MAKKKIKKNEIVRLLADWKREFRVFTPSKGQDNSSRMVEWDGSDIVLFEWYRNTSVPTKSLFLPPVEELFNFQKTAGEYCLESPQVEERKSLIFGIRPCDAQALTSLDRVFNDGEPDPYYATRRANTVLVGIACTNPYGTCFCTSFDGSPFDSRNVDLLLTDIGSDFLIEAITEAGSALLDKSEWLQEATVEDEALARKTNESAGEKVTSRLELKNIRERLSAVFEDKAYWENIAATCISCGVCTLLCPTCHCFDISDETLKGAGQRLRSPDSCSFVEYTKMPAENPREEKWRRLRNRICHKFLFFPLNFGVTACTGCGRCIRMCPVKWDIRQMLNDLTVNTSEIR